MKLFILPLFLALTGGHMIEVSTGVVAAALSGTPTTSAINMEAYEPARNTEYPVPTDQLSLTLTITPGTSLIADVRCYESSDNSTWGAITICDYQSPISTCVPDVRRYTMANYAGTTKVISTRWVSTKKYIKCSVDDPADGSGTVTITGVRS